MSRVIICANQKGGTGKTTTAINLAAGLARKGQNVLLIDNDSQGSCTAALGYKHPDEIQVTLATLMEKIINMEDILPEEGVIHHAEGFDLIPANVDLIRVENMLHSVMGSETVLAEYIAQITLKYDYILIDCSPHLGKLTLNALAAADEVIIPVQASYLPMKGLEQLLATISQVKRRINRGLRISGILLTMVDTRTNYRKDIISLIHSAYGDKLHIFYHYIPKSIRIEESETYGLSIYSFDKNGKAAAAYLKLTEEVMKHEL